ALGGGLVQEVRPLGRRRAARVDAGVAAVREGVALPHGAVRVEEDGAAWVVLVVEQELAEAAGVVVVRVPRVRIGAEVEDVARVPRTRPVGAYEPDRAVDLLLARGAVGVELDVRLGQGLAAADRVVAGGAVEPVEAGPR